jgi:ankyrin repeat protein
MEQRIPPDNISKANSLMGLIGRGASKREMQTYLERRPDAVRHVTFIDGSTMLHVALREDKLEAVEVLLSAGADIFAQDDFNQPALVSLFMHRGKRSRAVQIQLENLLPLSQAFEELDFPHLHKVVLKIRPLDLRSQLEQSISCDELNQTDS